MRVPSTTQIFHSIFIPFNVNNKAREKANDDDNKNFKMQCEGIWIPQSISSHVLITFGSSGSENDGKATFITKWFIASLPRAIFFLLPLSSHSDYDYATVESVMNWDSCLRMSLQMCSNADRMEKKFSVMKYLRGIYRVTWQLFFVVMWYMFEDISSGIVYIQLHEQKYFTCALRCFLKKIFLDLEVDLLLKVKARILF